MCVGVCGGGGGVFTAGGLGGGVGVLVGGVVGGRVLEPHVPHMAGQAAATPNVLQSRDVQIIGSRAPLQRPSVPVVVRVLLVVVVVVTLHGVAATPSWYRCRIACGVSTRLYLIHNNSNENVCAQTVAGLDY
jgi:hypothetical protein